MKKLASLISFVFAAVVLTTGCGLNSQFKDEPNFTDISGIITAQPNSDSRPGTHILTDEDGMEYPVRSLSLNLSGKNYLDNKVKLNGSMGSDDVFEVTGITVLEVLNGHGSTADAIEYKNTDYGFETMIYSDWKVEEGDGFVRFVAPSTEEGAKSDYVMIDQEPFYFTPQATNSDENAALKAYFEEKFPTLNNFSAFLSKIGKDEMSALKFDEDAGRADYYVYRSGLIYKLSFIPSTNFDEDNLQIFNEMVAEFRFLGFTVNENNGGETDLSEVNKANEALKTSSAIDTSDVDASSMTHFESLPYYFKASYPTSWYYTGVKGSKSGILHHYGFSEEADGEEIISLNVLASSSVSEGQISKVPSGSVLRVYTKVEGQSYEVSGPSSMEKLLVSIAKSIQHIER
ncbi:hypothetical protein COU74_03220 [Candidatus Peregrinibacteria bacterium CG10_big_fil_rev_8_21_14_0_10_36_19]|nr:MAG: hypothetical protein COU74_03220 [Candidatus Peregrinibacteria bacterium CG10_big_fil_rev_8_21_14_0_10_36_19]